MRGIIATILFLSISFLSVSARTTSFDEYWELDRINDYMFDLQERFPQLIEVEQMGITNENRTLFGVRIVNVTMLEQQNYSMPIILITAGASARDWISTMAAINVRKFLVNLKCKNLIIFFRLFMNWLNITMNLEFWLTILNGLSFQFSIPMDMLFRGQKE